MLDGNLRTANVFHGPPMSMAYVSFSTVYGIGWRSTETFPAQNLKNFFSSGVPIWAIRIFGKASLASN